MKQLVLIQDIGKANAYAYATNRLKKIGLHVLQAEEMSRKLEELDIWSNFNQQTTLLVFPGNGAGIVRSYLQQDWLDQWRTTTCYAYREWNPPDPPRAVIGYIEPAYQLRLNIQDVVVIDDVISSGETTVKLRRKNMPWIPNARWHATVWVKQLATDCVTGFNTTVATETVGGAETKAAINSLSTLVNDSHISRSFADRNLTKEQVPVFLDAISEIRIAQLASSGVHTIPRPGGLFF